MNRRESIYPTLEELVEANRRDPCRTGKPAKWPCLDGLSRSEKKKAIRRLWVYRNKKSVTEYASKWRSENRERTREYLRKFATTQKGKDLRRREKLHPMHLVRRRAYSRVAYDKQRGRINEKPCIFCGSKERLHAHHENYSMPRDIVWVCALHHAMITKGKLLIPKKKLPPK